VYVQAGVFVADLQAMLLQVHGQHHILSTGHVSCERDIHRALNCSVGLPSSLEQYNASHPVTAVLNNPPQLGAMHVTEWGLLPAAAPGCVSAGAVLGVWRGSAAAVCPCSGCEGCIRGQPL
jgi:hypothetical protein